MRPPNFGGTFLYAKSIGNESLGLPNTNPPTVVDQDNTSLMRFTVNTDHLPFKFPIPVDYDSGPMEFAIMWTNDGGGDDDGKNVKWQLGYQTTVIGGSIAGNHANSPKTVEDAYVGGGGWAMLQTDFMAIAQADFTGKHCIFLNIMAVTAPATVLTCEPHMIGLCYRYLRKRYPM